MRTSTMATSPTMEPSVAAAITPLLEAGKQTTVYYVLPSVSVVVGCVWCFTYR